MRIGLAILNRNEEAALEKILPRIPVEAVEGVFAVDGDSTDGSVAVLRRYGIEVLTQDTPGRGEAFRVAFREAEDRFDALILLSPDGNEDPGDIPRFRPLLEGGADMVIASRMTDGAVNEEDSRWFRPRKWANLAFVWLAWITWGRRGDRITDVMNGYRAITIDAWKRLNPDAQGYTIEYQASIQAYKRRLKLREFPTVEGQRIGGASGAKSIPTGLRMVRLYLSELLKSLRTAGGAP
jgi:glycosyltransferase involved in cell wall biosynthesis